MNLFGDRDIQGDCYIQGRYLYTGLAVAVAICPAAGHGLK